MEKNLLALSLICMLAVNAHSQPLAANCFEEYYTLFKSRGAKPVSDGDQKIVIATKSGGYSSCFLGKIAVKNGEIEFPVYVEKVDGSYEIFKTELSPALTHAEKEKSNLIEGGMTITFQGRDDELVKIFFITFLADKPKAYKLAPSAKSYLK